MSVAQILSGKGTHVVTTAPDKTLHETAQLMAQKGIGAVLVCTTAGEISGIISERDIMRAIAGSGAQALEQRVSSHMTRNVMTAEPSSTVVSVMQRMTAGRFRHMPVVRDGKLAGVVSIGDLIKHRLSELEHEQEVLKEYIATA